jgi:hypothetical protein
MKHLGMILFNTLEALAYAGLFIPPGIVAYAWWIHP